MRRQGLAGLRDDAPSHRSATMRHCCGGRRRVRRARAGFEIDHSEPQARVWRSRGRPGPTAPATPAAPQAPSNHATQTRGSPTGAKDQAGCWWAASGPGRALRRRAQPPISHHAPLLWRAPEGPEGAGGLRDRPLRAKLACGDLAGGRGLRRPQHQRRHKQHTQEGRRPPAHTAVRPAEQNARQPVRAAARSRN